MPADRMGQLISFASEIDPDAVNTNQVIWIRALHNGDTIRQIAGRRGHPELAAVIASMNHVRSITQKLRKGRLIKLPGTLQQGLAFDAHAQDGRRPKIVNGYAVFDTIDRPGVEGINHFKGYNPLEMDVPITFEGFTTPGAGFAIAAKIKALERMAGRGPGFKGAAQGPPAIIRVSVTDSHGSVVPLVPTSYQWTSQNPTAPLWRVIGIDWDDASVSNDAGYVVRQNAVVHLGKYTPVNLATSLTQRAKRKGF